MAEYRKKLIEVALPLDAINAESAREKSIRHGHPSTLHLWWARRPLAACRAVLFASLVDDPAEPAAPPAYLAALDRLPKPDPLPLGWDTFVLVEQRRERLFAFIARLVKWEASTDEHVLGTARELIRLACEGNPPPVLDPFCGGGSIPLEAQRLGLEAHASDLNPVAVLITKALIEIPPKFAGRPPVNPEWRREVGGSRKEVRGPGVPAAGGVAEGDGPGAGGVRAGANAAAGRDVRDAVATDARGSVDPGEQRGGVGEGIAGREGPVPSDRAGLAGGDGDLVDALRADRLVSEAGYSDPAPLDRGSGPHADRHAPQPPRDEERGTRREEIGVPGPGAAPPFPTSSPLLSVRWKGAAGLAADVRHYGRWMRDEAERRIGHLYPKAKLPDGTEATVIAWLWARTVRCPNPACGARMPLVRSFALSTKPGRQAWVEPVTDQAAKTVSFEVKTGTAGKPPEGTVNRRGARCAVCGIAVPFEHVRAEGKAGRMGAQLMAVVAEGRRGREYLPPTPEHESVAAELHPEWEPETELPRQALGFRVQNYGLTRHADLFTPRQLVALTTFSDLVGEARERVRQDAIAARLPDDRGLLVKDTEGATYADAVATYLALCVGRFADRNNSLCSWDSGPSATKSSTGGSARTASVRNAFARQALAMTWDFAEASPFSESGGGFLSALDWTVPAVAALPGRIPASVTQCDVTTTANALDHILVSTDPPYYDNIGYADLSDFFHVWLRRSLGPVYPDLFGTLLVPKAQELVATPYRFGGSKEKARQFFEEGLGKAFTRMREAQHPDYPLTVYYAFKQAEGEGGENDIESAAASKGAALGEVSTGWETMLQGLLAAGFQITGTWPVRSELSNRMVGSGTNALASSIVLVCRPRPENAPSASRVEFLEELAAAMRQELPVLASGKVAPVDLAQASIGPGMAVYSKYAQVIRQDGRSVTVREALADINNAIASYRAERVSSFDRVTRFCVDWYAQNGWADGKYGEADVLARAYNVGPNAMERDGLVELGPGKVRLEPPDSYAVRGKRVEEGESRRGEPEATSSFLRPLSSSSWEACLRLAQTLAKEGEAATAALARELGEGVSARARELAVWLYTIADQKKRADDAFLFNTLDASWSAIQEHIARMNEGQQSRF